MSDLEKARAISERKPYPASWEEELERAREIVREVGDLPADIAYEMLMRSPGNADGLEQIRALRPAGAPAYPASDRR